MVDEKPSPPLVLEGITHTNGSMAKNEESPVLHGVVR